MFVWVFCLWGGGGGAESRQHARPRHRWENIKMDVQEVEWGHGLDFSGSEQRQWLF